MDYKSIKYIKLKPISDNKHTFLNSYRYNLNGRNYTEKSSYKNETPQNWLVDVNFYHDA